MPILLSSFTALSDAHLLAEVTRLAGGERHATAQVIASLAELDARVSIWARASRRLRLLHPGPPSLGTRGLQPHRGRARRAPFDLAHGAPSIVEGRRFPVILDRLADGSPTLTTVRLLAAHLTPDNHEQVLDAAQHKSKAEVEELVAGLRPLPSVPSSIRKLPAARAEAPPAASIAATAPGAATAPPASAESRPLRPAVVAPLTPEQYKVEVTVSRETIEKLRRVQDLMRTSCLVAVPRSSSTAR